MSEQADVKLTERQQQVFDLLPTGVPQKVIARELDVSPTRVWKIVRDLKHRFGVNHRSELIALHHDRKTGEPVPYSFSVAEKSDLQDSPFVVDEDLKGEVTFADSENFLPRHWQPSHSAPEVSDVQLSTLALTGIIAGFALLLVVIIILAGTAMAGVSGALG